MRARLVVVTLPFALAVSALGCAGAATGECPAPPFEGTATDEVLTILGARTDFKEDDPAGPNVTAPTANQSFPASGDAPTLAWDNNLSTLLFHGDAQPADIPSAPAPSVLDRLSHLVIPTAYAHLPPVSGGMYIGSIAVAGDDCPALEVTSLLSWKIEDDAWAKMKAVKGKFTLDLKSAYFVEGRITDGPYRSKVDFTVE
ncbi:MAG TPA: hypothetical protein VGO62_18635 [Myxococcota bacterium]